MGVTATWLATNGDWFSAGNWSEPNPDGSNMALHYVPTADNDAVFNGPGPYTVTYDGTGSGSIDGIDDTTQTVTLAVDGGSLTLGADGGDIGALSTAVGATFLIADSASFRIVGAPDNAGTIALNAGRLTFGLQTTPSPVSLTGGGKITLSDSANNEIFIDNDASLDNVDNTISGAGSISSNFTSLTNEAKGVIDATGTLYSLILSVPTVTNKGLLEDTGTGGLTLSAPNGTTIDNVGGTIAATGAGTHVDLSGATIVGGTLSTSGGGVIQTTSGTSTLDGTGANAPVTITAGSTVQLDDNTNLVLAGGPNAGVIDNQGTIALNSTGDLARLTIGYQTTSSPVVLQGGGAVTLSDSADNNIFIDNSASLDNVDNTISGAGSISSNFTSLTNEAKGVIDATGTLNGLGLIVPNVTNEGLIEATGAGGLQLSNSGVSTSIANAGGTIAANGAGAHVDIGNGTKIAGGTLSSSGGGVIQVIDDANVNSLDGTDADGPLTIATGTTVQLNDKASLALVGTTASTGVIVNHGTIALDAGADETSLSATGGGTTMLTGGGRITLSDSANNLIGGRDNGGVLDNVDNTISGAGAIDSIAGRLSLINGAAGVIDGTGTSNALSVQNISVTNTGLIEDTGSAGLTLADANVTNTGGTISAVGANAHVDLVDNGIGSTTIVGGTLTTSGGGVINVTNSTASLEGAVTVTGTLAGAGTLAIASGDTTFASGAALTTANLGVGNGAEAEIATPLTYAGTLLNNGTVMLDGADSLALSGAVSGSGTIGFASGAAATLQLDAAALPDGQTFANTVTGFAPGDEIDLRGLTFAGATAAGFDASNGTLTVTEGNVTDTLTLVTPGATNFALQSDSAGGTEIEAVCFASGTHIRTMRGEVAVEALKIGDLAVTASGEARPIRWLGHRTLACRRHPRPDAVMPIRIAAHAFGPNRPARDLVVSQGHAIWIDVLGEVLIPAGALVDDAGVRREDVDTVTYWHVELDSHDLLVAENLACESYLEMGNRGFFGQADVVALAGHPDGQIATHADFCRPFHADGPLVAAARTHLAARAWRLAREIRVEIAA